MNNQTLETLNQNENQFRGHYLRDIVKTNVNPRVQSFNYFTKISEPPHNKGLYSGPVINNIYMAPNTPPTSTNFTMLLSQISTTPGANLQYNGVSRLGNNHIAMPNIYRYNPKNQINSQNTYNILGPL